MTSADICRFRSNKFLLYIIIIILIITSLLVALPACGLREEYDRREDSMEGGGEGEGETLYEGDLYLFDYEKIALEKTGSIGIEIRNCNIYTDIYEDLIILGEIENISTVNKTDIEVTLDFYNIDNEVIMSETIPSPVNYLNAGSRFPFYYYLYEREKFIEINKIKIGADYKDYNRGFKGNPVVEGEKYYYSGEGNSLVIEGSIINIGENKIKNLELFCTFYNDKEQVVFIKNCYLLREEMIPGEEQRFTLEVMLDEYLPGFTHYRFEVFFEDEIKAGALFITSPYI